MDPCSRHFSSPSLLSNAGTRLFPGDVSRSRLADDEDDDDDDLDPPLLLLSTSRVISLLFRYTVCSIAVHFTLTVESC